MFLAAMLAVNAIMHFIIVARFGLKGNEPPLVFGVLYAALAAGAAYGATFVLWATIAVAVVGTLGLLVNWRKIAHDKSGERVILGFNVLLILYAGLLLTFP